jgi:TetR/AcrR family transcriptional regulator, cholesterol catabolism regulator
MTKTSNISRRRDFALSEGSSDYLNKRAELVVIAGQQFKANGFRATTLAEIGRKAGLDRATVYYYFASKEELLRECVLVGVEANVTACEAIAKDAGLTARDRLKAIINQLMKAYDQHYPNMYVYIQEEMTRVTSEKSVWAHQITGQTRTFERIVMGLIAELIDTGEMRRDIPVSIAANAIFGMLNWTHRWYQPGGPHPAAEVSGAFCDIFFDGMMSAKP